VKEYLENGVQLSTRFVPGENNGRRAGNKDVEVILAEIFKNEQGCSADLLSIDDAVLFHVKYKLKRACMLNLSLVLWTQKGDCVFNVCTDAASYEQGIFESLLKIPANFLNDDVYRIELYFIENTSKAILRIEDIIVFEMHEPTRNANWYDKWVGIIRPKLEFKITEG
jgi:lipopolysaccharide transport system ATP-binding protein